MSTLDHNTANANAPLTTFHHFTKFPLEIQLAIFENALPACSSRARLWTVTAILENVSPPPSHKPQHENPLTKENQHEARHYVRFQCRHGITTLKKIALLPLATICKAAREVYLKEFSQTLPTGESTLMRFAGEDLIEISM